MRPLSEATARIAAKSFERKYIAIGRIVNHWEDIVGTKLADKAQPVRILYRKKEKQKSPDATLEIATSSADATLLHYQKDVILERINQIFGERWITAIRFVNVSANTPIKKIKKRPAPLTPGEKKILSEMLFSVTDDDIKSRLENLGKSIIAEKKT